MAVDEWQRKVLFAAHLAGTGDGYSLHLIALLLEDGALARESLIGAGFGTDEDSLTALVACVIEGKPDVPA